MLTTVIAGTDLSVSRMCLGTGDYGAGLSEDDSTRQVERFMELGGNFLDTAHCYAFWVPGGLGVSERTLGAAVRRLGVSGQVVIATKGGHPDMGADYRRPDSYLAPETIASDLDESLDRLQADSVPLYYLHRDDARVPVGEIIDALNREAARGRIRHLGASNWSRERVTAANSYAVECGLKGFSILQDQFSAAVPLWSIGPDPTMRYVDSPAAEWHRRTGMAVAAYSATANGYFSDPDARGQGFASPDNRKRAGAVAQVAVEIGSTPTQSALAYLMQQPFPVFPVFSTSSLTHLAECMGAQQFSLSDAQIDRICQA